MPLHELQESFSAAMFNGDTTIDRNIIAACALSPRDALSIYRSSLLGNYLGALKTSYPVIQALLGEVCFAALIKQYALVTPSRSGDLNDFGEDFDGWIATHPATCDLAYLPDVARLEWAVDVASRAAESERFDVSTLQRTSPDAFGAVHFRLHPSAQLLAATWPALDIWQTHQSKTTDISPLRVERALHHYLVLRTASDNEVSIVEITSGAFAWLQALKNDLALSEALDAAQDIEAQFDLSTQIQQHIVLGSFMEVIV